MPAPINAWQQHQLHTWLRPNNLYWKVDAARYLPEQLHYLLPPQLRLLTKSADGVYRPNVVQGTGQRGRWRPEDDTALKAEQQRRSSASALREIYELKSVIAKIRYDLAFERFKHNYYRWVEEERRRKANFNPAQPRDEVGRWTLVGGGINDPRVLSDVSPDPIRPGAQYAQGPRGRGGIRGPIIINGRPVEPTPGQAARLAIVEARAQNTISRVQEIDPYWRQTPSSYEGVEGLISARAADAREAQEQLGVFNRLNITPESIRPNQIGRSSEYLLTPDGVEIGSRFRGAADNIRTISPTEFSRLQEELLIGARPIPAAPGFRGMWYERQDGLQFSLRLGEYGPTLEVIRSNSSLFERGFKVHQK